MSNPNIAPPNGARHLLDLHYLGRRYLLDYVSDRTTPPPEWTPAKRFDLPEGFGEDSVLQEGRNSGDVYYQEALLEAIAELRPPGHPLSSAMVDAYRRNFGIPAAHPVSVVRRILADAYLSAGCDSPEARLMIWGTGYRHGNPLYRQVGALMRCPWLDGIAVQAGVPKSKLVTEWANLLNLEQPQVRHAVEKIVVRELDRGLARHPEVEYLPLSMNMLAWVARLTGDNVRLAYYFFRVLQRVLAYERGGYVMFRSKWLRAEAQDPRAIPGCSGHYADVKSFLNMYVLERVAGHQAGKRSAIYRLRRPIEPGELDHRAAARFLRLRLDDRDVPRGLVGEPHQDLEQGPPDPSTPPGGDRDPYFPSFRDRAG